MSVAGFQVPAIKSNEIQMVIVSAELQPKIKLC